jgi:hypothetical protein
MIAVPSAAVSAAPPAVPLLAVPIEAALTPAPQPPNLELLHTKGNIMSGSLSSGSGAPLHALVAMQHAPAHEHLLVNTSPPPEAAPAAAAPASGSSDVVRSAPPPDSSAAAAAPSFFQTHKTAVVIGGAVGVLVTGVGLFLALKK